MRFPGAAEEMRVAPGAAAILLAGAAAAALLADRLVSVAVLAFLLLVAALRAPARRRWPYLAGAVGSGMGVLVVSPFVAVEGFHVLWSGPSVPVLGALDVTREELEIAALAGARLCALALAFSVYALLVDHDRLLAGAGFARRSALAAVLATRLVPTLERDALGLAEAVRGRGIPVEGVRARARLVSPLIGGSLERALNLAESMEARGFGRPGRTRAPGPGWGKLDQLAAVAGALLVLGGVLWL